MNLDQFVLPFYEPGMKHSSLCSKAQIRIYIKKLVDEILGIRAYHIPVPAGLTLPAACQLFALSSVLRIKLVIGMFNAPE